MKITTAWKAWKLIRKKEPRTSGEFEKLPEHVAIIMDGNGRWARKHKLSVSKGHRQGTETLREIIRHTDDLGIRALSLYAFSTENWNRSEEEVAALMQLILDFFDSEIDELDAKNVRILILGDKSAAGKTAGNAEGSGTADAGEYRAAPEHRHQLRRKGGTGEGSPGNFRAGKKRDAADGGYHRGDDFRASVYPGAARCGSPDPHQRGTAAEQFPAVSERVRGVCVPGDAVAGFYGA